MGKLVCLISTLVCFQLANSAPSSQSALLYLSQFGYLGPTHITKNSSGALVDEKSFQKGIEEFQMFAGLDVTGKLDPQTIETMSLPRCGVKDKVGTGDNRSKRYALQGSRWKVKDLKYRITKYPTNLKRSAVDDTIQKAFNVWTDYTDLTFTPSTGHVHIDIRFEKGEHGDGDPFDGPGGTLAHAYFPVYGGDAHFDASERWTVDSYSGTNLFQVAAHEFGHSLGLSHSDVREALMAPFYRGYDPIFNLHEDDIYGIQALYGKKTKKAARPSYDDDGDVDESKVNDRKEPVPKPAGNVPDQDLCKNQKIDVIFTTADGQTYVFRGDKFWKLTDDTVAPGYPKLISSNWPGLPSDIDAAFTYKNGKTYFFKGSKYWRYKGSKMDGTYPKEISEGFTGIPDNVDTALVWSGNGKIYFFKGSKFWRFDPSARPPVKNVYPKPISNWEGLPDNLDAGFQWTNGYTYFFKDGGYYRFNDKAFAIDKVTPAFPRASGHWWFGCENSPEGTIGTSESRDWLVNGEGENNDDASKIYHDTDDINNLVEEKGPTYGARTNGNSTSNQRNGSSSISSSVSLLSLLVTLKLIYSVS